MSVLGVVLGEGRLWVILCEVVPYSCDDDATRDAARGDEERRLISTPKG